MNKYLDGVLVVEGKTDAAILSSFIKTPIFVTNGFELDFRLISLLQKVEQKSKIFILTDNDDSGAKIREKLTKSLQKPIILQILTSKYTSKHKHGIAEIDYGVLRDFFSSYFVDENQFKNDINETLIYKIGKEKILADFDLPVFTIKGIVKCLNALKIPKDELIKQYGN